MPSVDSIRHLHHNYERTIFNRTARVDYSGAFNRLVRSSGKPHQDNYIFVAYERANHIAETLIDRRPRQHKALFEEELRIHIDRWKSDTIHWSSMTRRLAHPSYLRIIGLAKNFYDYEVERALLLELQKDPDHWFAALVAITGEDPVKPENDFDEAIDAWLTWGREKGII